MNKQCIEETGIKLLRIQYGMLKKQFEISDANKKKKCKNLENGNVCTNISIEF